LLLLPQGMMGRKLLKKESADKQDFLPLLLMAGKGMSKMQKAQKQEVQQQVVSFLCMLVYVVCHFIQVHP
jgi:hypothetical protein